MSKGLGQFLQSSLGKKFVMALSGLLLVGFLLMHLLGNLTLYGGSDGAKFIKYATSLHDLGPLMVVAEAMLVLLFGIHVYYALRLIRENRAARPLPYAARKTLGQSTLASRTMPITGLIVLGFLVGHLLHLRFREGLFAPHADQLHAYVVDRDSGLAAPLFGAFYLLGSLAVGLHVSHGFRSLFQSLGLNHPLLNRIAGRLAVGLSILIGLGFASFPVIALFVWRNR